MPRHGRRRRVRPRRGRGGDDRGGGGAARGPLPRLRRRAGGAGRQPAARGRAAGHAVAAARDYSLLDVERHFEVRGARRLDYCSSRGARDGTSWSGLRAERVVAELGELAERYRLSEVLFRDEDFFADAERVEAIAGGLADEGGALGWQGGRAGRGRWWPPGRSSCASWRRAAAASSTWPSLPARRRGSCCWRWAPRLHAAWLVARFVFEVSEPDRRFDGLDAAVSVARSLCAIDRTFETPVRRARPAPEPPRHGRVARELGRARRDAVAGRPRRAPPGPHDLLLRRGAAPARPPAGQAPAPHARPGARAARLLRARLRAAGGRGRRRSCAPAAARAAPSRRLSRRVGLLLRAGALPRGRGVVATPRDVRVERGVVRAAGAAGTGGAEIDLDGRLLLPALVNAHDVLDQSTLPALGAGRRTASLYEWTRASRRRARSLAAALAVPLVDRLFLGGAAQPAGRRGLRPAPPPRPPLARAARTSRCGCSGATPSRTRRASRRRCAATYRTSDRRIPWIVRAAEGSDPGAARRARRAGGGERAAAEHRDRARHGARAGGRAARSPPPGPSLAWCPESDLRLYGRTAPVAALRAAGVRVGLGSDGAAAGARDLLSNLAAARREGGLDDAALARARDARLRRRWRGCPSGGFADGAPADLLVTRLARSACSPGDRRAHRAPDRAGRAPSTASPRSSPRRARPSRGVTVDGERALRSPRRSAGGWLAILRRHPRPRGAPGCRESRYNPRRARGEGRDAGAPRDPVRDGGAEGQGAATGASCCSTWRTASSRRSARSSPASRTRSRSCCCPRTAGTCASWRPRPLRRPRVDPADEARLDRGGRARAARGRGDQQRADGQARLVLREHQAARQAVADPEDGDGADPAARASRSASRR